MKKYITEGIEDIIEAAIVFIRSALLFLLFISICMIPTTAIWAFVSMMEARAYNRVTGSDVSTWEAMWVTLRVDGKSN